MKIILNIEWPDELMHAASVAQHVLDTPEQWPQDNLRIVVRGPMTFAAKRNKASTTIWRCPQ